jgi:cardiolipin synthase
MSVQTVQSSPTDGSSNALVLHSLAVLCATRYLYVANPYFVPNPSVMAQLADACARGVDVKVMVAGEHCDTWMARRNSTRLYGKLLEAGVQIYEFRPTMLHQKTMVVDDVWATIGTTNFDNRSFALNEETNLCFHDAAVVTRMREIFEADLARCDRVRLDAWRRRGLVARAGELIAALFRDQV